MRIFEDNAMRLWESGLAVIPCFGKAPTVKAWTRHSKELPSQEDIELWAGLYPTANIGLVCGPASGIVALDIDNPSLVDKMPKSPVVLRGREDRETRLFKYTSNIKLTHLTGVDVISTGGQIILPPSIHPDTKKPYVWLSGGLPFDNLPELVMPDIVNSQVNTPVNSQVNCEFIDTFSSYESSLGQEGRNNRLTAISYAMACQGATLDEIRRRLLEDESASWFSDKSEPHRGLDPNGQAVLMAKRAITSASLKGERIDLSGDISIGGIDKVLFGGESIGPTPQELYTPPPIPPRGALRDMYEYIQSLSNTDIPSLALGGSLAIASTLITNRFKVCGNSASMFILNIAPSGTGKSFPYMAVEHIIPFQFIGEGAYQSYKAVLQDLGERRERLDVLDEVSAMFVNMKDGSTYQSQMVDVLCGLWANGPETYYRFPQSAGSKANNDRKGVYSPGVNILASTTNDGILSSSNKLMSQKGLFPRFLIFEQPKLEWRDSYIDSDALLEKVLKWRDLILSHKILLEKENEFSPNNPQRSYTEAHDLKRLARDVPLRGDEDAKKLGAKHYRAHQELLKDRAYDHNLDPFYARRTQHVLKIALAYEVGLLTSPVQTDDQGQTWVPTQSFNDLEGIVGIDDGFGWIREEDGPKSAQAKDSPSNTSKPTYAKPERFMIGQEALEWAESLYDWMISQKTFLADLIDSSEKMRLFRKMEDFVEGSKKKGVTKADLTLRFRHHDKRLREEVLHDLIASEKIFAKKDDSMTRPVVRFYYSRK